MDWSRIAMDGIFFGMLLCIWVELYRIRRALKRNEESVGIDARMERVRVRDYRPVASRTSPTRTIKLESSEKPPEPA